MTTKKLRKNTEGLIWSEKCLECIKDCKIELLPKSVLVKCPDFKKGDGEDVGKGFKR